MVKKSTGYQSSVTSVTKRNNRNILGLGNKRNSVTTPPYRGVVRYAAPDLEEKAGGDLAREGEGQAGGVSLLLAIRTESEANLHEHRMAKARRTKLQRSIIRNRLGQLKKDFRLGEGNRSYIVTLTRIAPRPLDDDNLPRAFKAIRDGVADAFGMDDSARSKLQWKYAQEKGPPKQYAVRIKLEPAGNGQEGRRS